MSETLTIELRDGGSGASPRPAPAPPSAAPPPVPAVPRVQIGQQWYSQQEVADARERKAKSERSAALNRFVAGDGKETGEGKDPLADQVGALMAQMGMGKLGGAVQSLGKAFAAPPAPSAGAGQAAGAAGKAGQAAGAAEAGAGAGAAEAAGAAGAMGGAAAALGPIGAIVAVAKMVEDELKAQISKAISNNGAIVNATLQSVGSLDPMVAVRGYEEAVKKMGLFGEALGTAVGIVRGFYEAVGQTVQRLAPYHGDLAQANAMQGVEQILGDIRRAQYLGNDLSRLTQAQTRASQAGQDAMASLLRPILPLASRVMEMLATFIEYASEAIAKFLGQPDQKKGQGILDEILGSKNARFGSWPLPPPVGNPPPLGRP